MIIKFTYLKIRAQAQIQKILIRISRARFAIVRKHVLIVRPIHAYAYNWIAIVTECAYAWELARYLKATHRISSLEKIATVESQRSEFYLPIKVLILQIKYVHGSFVATSAQITTIAAKIYP